jgi:hypothetical protein
MLCLSQYCGMDLLVSLHQCKFGVYEVKFEEKSDKLFLFAVIFLRQCVAK